jgi:Kef-type K+ transport system membrane component KefB
MIDMEIVGGISAIAFIIGLLEFLQKVGLNKKYLPFIALAFGLLTSIGYYYYGNTTWFEAIIIGIMLGLCATGVCYGTREMVDAFRSRNK